MTSPPSLPPSLRKGPAEQNNLKILPFPSSAGQHNAQGEDFTQADGRTCVGPAGGDSLIILQFLRRGRNVSTVSAIGNLPRCNGGPPSFQFSANFALI